MWWSAWSRNQIEMPVAGSRRRCSQARQSASRRLIASAWRHHSGHQVRWVPSSARRYIGRELFAHELLHGRVEQLRRPPRGLPGSGSVRARRPSRSPRSPVPAGCSAPARRASAPSSPRGRARAATAGLRRRAGRSSRAACGRAPAGRRRRARSRGPWAGRRGRRRRGCARAGWRASWCGRRLACETDVVGCVYSPISWERSARKSASATPPP